VYSPCLENIKVKLEKKSEYWNVTMSTVAYW
jgi:hypothetical protein